MDDRDKSSKPNNINGLGRLGVRAKLQTKEELKMGCGMDNRKADVARWMIETKIDMHVKKMISTAEYIIRDLECMVEDLKANGIKANINTLGILQSLGTDLDRMCGEFGVLRETKTILEAVMTE